MFPTRHTPGRPFALGVAALAVGAAVLAGALPVGVSIAAVFLFAGPHNWFEARYVLGRLPARAGKLHAFFVVSAVGVLGLTATYPLLPRAGDATAYALWNSAFLFWVAALVWMRSRTNPRFDGGWVWPVACLLSAGVWLEPIALNVALIYLHPLLALWLLDRELTRSRRAWRFAYRCAVAVVPVLLLGLWFTLRHAPDLPGADPLSLTAKIVDHSGSGFLSGVSTHFLVAAHAFLELVHYGVWVVLIPLVGLRSWPWELDTIPAARRGRTWVAAVLVAGLVVVLLLWVGFALDYSTTRSVYFTVAVLHVLAEVPFLLRMV